MPTVSSTVGSPTRTCWKRRSSAASFSMCWRYSSSVVAPTMRSSPRASIGLIMLPASMAPSPVAPAPTIVCSSSMNVMTWPADSVISLRTALSRSSNSPRNFAPATIAPRSSADHPLAEQRLRHVTGHDPLRQALDDRGLADARLADEHRVVLRAPRQHLHDAADLGVAADHRVELALAGPVGQVDAVLLQRLVGALRVGAGDPGRAADLDERVAQRVRRRAVPVQQVGDRAALGRETRPAGARSRRTRRPSRWPASARG